MKEFMSTLLDKVHLPSTVAKSYVTSLSGGMQRKVCLALSLIGKPKILFLDEPTTGMDPISRHHIWELLHSIKDNTLMILTTHSMEEADELGDTICILHNGVINAYGSSIFLKNHFGEGYQVKVMCDPTKQHSVYDILNRTIRQYKIDTDAFGNMSVRIPNDFIGLIPSFIKELTKSHGLIKEWGITNTTLEDVYMKLVSNNQSIQESNGTATTSHLCFHILYIYFIYFIVYYVLL